MKLINRIIDGNGKIKKINWNHSNGKLNLSIDDTDLVYPIVIDPTVEPANQQPANQQTITSGHLLAQTLGKAGIISQNAVKDLDEETIELQVNEDGKLEMETEKMTTVFNNID